MPDFEAHGALESPFSFSVSVVRMIKLWRIVDVKGAVLCLALAPLLGVVPGTEAQELAEFASVMDFGAKCDGVTDDAAAVQKAVDSALRVRFPAGTCLLNSTVTLRAGSVLRGEGMKVSIVKQGGISATSMGTFYANSGLPGSRLEGIRLSDMTIYGQSDVSGFAEFQHLVSLNGVKDVLIEKVELRGFRGDGLYIGSGIIAGDERHNEDIVVRDSIFDGVNHTNRNGISIIDGDGVLIEGNTFRNTTQPKMPGAIDIEPNGHSFHVVRNVTIRNNTFSGIRGNVVISILFNSRLRVTPTGFLVEGNTVAGKNGGILFRTGVGATPGSNPHDLVIANNVVTTLGRSLVISGAKEFNVHGNVFADAVSTSLIGLTAGADKCMNGVIADNEFRNIRNIGLAVFSVDRLEISRNRFIDIGTGAPRSYAINFDAGISSHIRLLDNVFTAPTGKTAYAIHKEASHTFTPATNTARNNQLIGVSGNAFQATGP